MSKTLVPFIPPSATPAQLETFLRGFCDLERATERSRILAQALQGLCLAELQTTYGFTKGGDHKSGTIKPAQCGFDSWEEYLDKTFGISDDTASRRMKCWGAVKQRIAKLSGPDAKAVYRLLSKPMTRLSAKEWELLRDVTHKVTDKASQVELLEEAKYLIDGHGAGLGKGKGKKTSKDDDGETPAPTPELLIQDELFGPMLRIAEHWHAPLAIQGKVKVPLWQHMSKAQLRKAVETLEEMIAPAREALERK